MRHRFDELKQEVFRLYAHGRYAQALELVEAGLPEHPEQIARLTFWAAALECRLQRPGEALGRLQAHIAGGGWVNPGRLRDDEDLAPLRERPGWAELVAVCEQRRAQERARTRPELQLEPARSPHAALPPLVVALHMMGGDIAEARANWLPVTELGCALAMPQGSELLGPGEFGWGERAVEQVARQLEEVGEAHPVDLGRVVFGGASRGAALAVEMAVRGQPLPSRGFIAIVGAPKLEALRPHIDRAREAGVRGMFISGDGDYFLPKVRDAHELLEQAGLEVKLEVVPGLGHEYPAALPELLRTALESILR